MALIKNPEIRDPDALALLSGIPAQLKQLKLRRAQIDREAGEIEAKLGTFDGPMLRQPIFPTAPSVSDFASAPSDTSRPARTMIRVKINWTSFGKNLPPEDISLSKGSDTLATVLDRLAAVVGTDVLERLQSFSVSRGPLVSKSPSTDFVNRANGRLYQHQRIGLTPYHVLTHSSTPEKVDYLRQIHRFLSVPKEGIEVAEVAKY